MDQPRLTHLLNNRTALDPLEIKSIRHEVHVRSQAIERLQLELQKLESERAAWQSLLSPLRRNSIPPEILGEIFNFVLLATENTKPWRSQVNLLCRVCKAWRDVALAMPSLWAQLDEIVVRKQLDVAKVRNAGKTLSIEGQHRYPDLWPSSPDAWRLLDHLPPVTSLTLGLPEPDIEEDDDNPESPLPRSILTANLTKLCIKSMWTMVWILDIVKTCINLESLVLEYGPGIHHVDEEVQIPSSKILLPKLHSLKLRVDLYSQTTRILRYLVIPSLEALEISYYGDQEPLDELSLPKMKELCGDLLSLVSGSNAVTDLRYLHLENLPIASVSLYRILSAFPSLRHLTLDNVDSDSALFRYRDIRDEPPLLLELEVLEMFSVPPAIDPDEAEIAAESVIEETFHDHSARSLSKQEYGRESII
ncbi:hypothetical protein DFP72DRAFT_841502 [Ephemerocybe angulata]|uniref:F-box domain-containing protein n=1 Tax=Ephemerocybe angulata TaxID=980116 RepID=A0A8H6MF14_9AGAR|nr:hypothetical protein DFP72DRAFT_841502 [Tulosesus angulatus]